MNSDIIRHYDLLVEENNDPVHDPEPLREYMNLWDGPLFVEKLELDKTKSVLEIGVGTGRLAVRTAPLCGAFCGIDISPKTISRARENLSAYGHVELKLGDFMTVSLAEPFDVIYSSLTFMHIQKKEKAIRKAAGLLRSGGRFVLSIDKNQNAFIDTGTRRIAVYPDDPTEILRCISVAGLKLVEQLETEFAYIFVADRV